MLGELDDFAFGAMRDGNAIDPFNLVRIKNEFVFGLRVVEDGHFVAADDDELLLFEWMQPADEDVRFDAALEAENRESDIGNWMIEIAGALSGDGRGGFTEKVKDCGDVMGRETPKDVFFRAELAKIQS